MEDLVLFLKSEPNIQVQDLVWTLLQKRSVMPVRRAITGQTITGTRSALEAAITSINAKEGLVVTNGARRTPEILGIFTGQGAQWPAMGKVLISTIPYARELILQLDRSLSSLPPDYRPAWTLQEQLSLEGDASNVNIASFSQPLCCAVQILLVQLLKGAGVKFRAVVGHSSGEIACAYAAGFITASQAIRIAYLRGVVTKQATSPHGVQGAMLAAGCSYEDAQELCNLEIFEGRICVAACNAPDSVTLSGDSDAIDEAQAILEDESRFVRLLKVDKAYHSLHMLPCAAPYITALEASGCGAAATNPEGSPFWISSVHKGRHMAQGDATSDYWKDNLLSPVLFSQALVEVVKSHMPLDIAVEVGCHPALKGPSLTTIEHYTSVKLPYIGCMRRGGNDLDAFASALGYIWERFGSQSLDLTCFNKIMPQVDVKNLAAQLPCYPWDHSRSYWTEPRKTRAFLRGTTMKPHILLGKLSDQSTTASLRWHNSIRPRDIPWLDGHHLQGQTVFPGAAYVIMAAEAATHAAAGRSVQLLEITDLQIFKAVTFESENSLVELDLVLDIDLESSSVDYMKATFAINCCLSKENSMSPSTRGKIITAYGPESSQVLSTAPIEPPHMSSISVDSFYKELAIVGHEYDKDFRGLSSMKRADNQACGTMLLPKSAGDGLFLHPATLDIAFQTLLGAVSAPGDGLMRSILVPTSVGRIAIIPWLCSKVEKTCEEIRYHASGSASQMSSISGDVAVFEPHHKQVLIQIEDLTTKMTSAASAINDHVMFAKWKWDQLIPDRILSKPQYAASNYDREVAAVMERMVYFYIKSIIATFPVQDRLHLLPHHEKQLEWFEVKYKEAQDGQNLFYDTAWEADQKADIDGLVTK